MLKTIDPRLFCLFIALIGLGAILPWFVNSYVLSILILTLHFAFLGQAWNLMMGFAGQLSLGHTLYVGIGSYLSASFFVYYGLNPWLSMFLAAGIGGGIGAIIAFLGFRFAIRGVYFALLTIAFAECARILFSHWTYFGASAGLFLPVQQHDTVDLLNMRGPDCLFYYIMMVLTFSLFIMVRWIMHTRIGYFWLALREDPEAAQSLGVNLLRTKITAVALSAALTSAGGVVYAFYQNSLFPEQSFAMSRSIEILTGPIIGGLGTLFGPILGALVLIPLGEFFSNTVTAFGWEIPGLKHLFYGLSMLLVMVFLPKGLWPPLKNIILKRAPLNK